MRLTEEQRQAIYTQGQVIVSAAAGSGKTFVMIERLVDLILKGQSVKNVLAVTFTNKAAAQMRQRLRDAIIDRMNTAAGEEKARLKEELLSLPLADISTIHAFCGRLVRTNFFLAGVDAGFSIISPDDAEGRTLTARALDEVFEEEYIEKSEGFMKLLAAYFRRKKDAKLRSMVLALHTSVRGLSSYRAVLDKIGRGEMFENACEYLFSHYHARALYFKTELEGRKEFLQNINAKALTVCSDVCLACEKLLAADDLFAMADAAREKVTISSMPPMTKATGEELGQLRFLSGASKGIKALYKELATYASREEELRRYMASEELAAALAALVLRFDDVYSRLKNEAGVLDYNDLEQLALRVLQNGEARREVLNRYRFVFVDEYQDVNPVQEEILSLLAGENVFLVGDGKQAIYGFRGSRSKYFDEKCASLPVSLQLSANFRSSKAVLDVVNRVFTPLIAGYTPVHGGGRYGEHMGEVCFHRLTEEKAERPERGVYSVLTKQETETDALAEKIADLVEEEVTRTWFDADAGEERKVRFGDIAVLARKNTGDSERIVRALARRDIPVTTTSKVNVCDFYEARLIIDCLSYLDNAEQDIPLASAMLSAAGGFSEEELTAIRLRFPATYAFRTACLQYSRLEDELAKKLRAFYARFDRLRSEARAQTAAETAVKLLAEGLEAQIASKRDGELRLARVRRLIAEGENCPNIHAFLARLKATDYCVEYAGGGGDGAVKVLTMHASKGLEYPVVLLAGLDAPFHGAEKDEVMWTEQFLFAPRSYDTKKMLTYDTVLRRASAVVQEREELDGERNLLYVDMTRARYRLHMVFSEHEGPLSPAFARRFSDFLDLPSYADLFVEEGVRPAPVSRKGVAARPDPILKEEILRQYGRPYPFEASVTLPVKSSATELMRTLRQPIFIKGDADMGGGFSVETGLAYHAFLENVRFQEDAEKELARMREEGILTKDECALLEVDKLRAILQIPCLKGLKGKRLYREQTFLVRLPACEILETDLTDEIVYQGAIDLLAEGEEGYEIIDYKYSSHTDERIRADYALQIKLYKKAVARAMKVDENTISARIINIALCREIPM